MSEIFKDIIDKFPIRHRKKQKDLFCEYIIKKYDFKDEKKGKTRNLVFGDVEKARNILTAHYDTTNNSSYSFICGVGGGVISYLKRFYSMLKSFFSLKITKSNPNNYNDNTSSISILISLSKKRIENTAIILLDNEERGFLGASFFNKKYKKLLKEKLVLNLDCVGRGRDIGIFYIEKKQKKLANEISKYFFDDKKFYSSFSFKPIIKFQTDAIAIENALNISAFQIDKRGMKYFDEIHTKRDNKIDSDNLEFIEERLALILLKDTLLKL